MVPHAMVWHTKTSGIVTGKRCSASSAHCAHVHIILGT